MAVCVSLQQVEMRALTPSRPVGEEPLVVIGRNLAGPVSRDRDDHVYDLCVRARQLIQLGLFPD